MRTRILKNSLSYRRPDVLASALIAESAGILRLYQLLSRPRRPRRSGEWTPERAVTFIVTLAATASVTLAARAAGMSRKSAYALKGRDRAFAAAWTAALRASRGNKVEEVDAPPLSCAHGDRRPMRRGRLPLVRTPPPHFVRPPSPRKAGEDKGSR